MSDFDNPHKDQDYLGLLSSIRDLFEIVSAMMDSRLTDPSNKILYAKRWNNANLRFEEWSGSAWAAKVLGIAGGGTGASTAETARANLGITTSGDIAAAIAAHDAVTSAHQAVSVATANRIIVRDAAGRAKVVAPSATTDIALKSTVDDHSNLTSPHSSTPSPTANRLIVRDGTGKAQVAIPTEAADITRKDYVDAAVAAIYLLMTNNLATKTRAKFVTNTNGNPNVSDTVLNVNSLVVVTWTTIGPTGGGCTVTWSALDSVPTDADWIEVRGLLFFSGVGMTASSFYSEFICGTEYGSTQATANNNMLADVCCYSDSAGRGGAAQIYTAKLPVSSRRIRLYRYATYTGGIHTSEMFLTGYGYNPT